MFDSMFRTVPSGQPNAVQVQVQPLNPYRLVLAGGAAILYAAAVVLLLLAVGGVIVPSGLPAILAAAAATLFLVAWLIVGALQWRPPETPSPR